jgi:hypothetical protein
MLGDTKIERVQNAVSNIVPQLFHLQPKACERAPTILAEQARDVFENENRWS